MFAKVLVLALSATFCAAAPGIYDIGHGTGVSYATVAAAPAYQSVALPSIHASPYIQAAPIIHSQPLIQKTILAQPQYIQKQIIAEPVDPNPQYSFAYGVTDPHTGDSKNAQETLANGVVHGSYSLVEPDGHIRKVTYTADKINGFNAVVERTGGAKLVAAAPIAKIAVAPAISLGHGSPW